MLGVMTPTTRIAARSQPAAWVPMLWFGGLLIVCYWPVLKLLVWQWSNDADMGHGFFVPLIAAYIVWQMRDRLARLDSRPSWWGLAIILYAALQEYVGSIGAELFLARTAFVFSIIGAVLLLGGRAWLHALRFPIFLLFFMIPLPAVIYGQITFPLQILASKAATASLSFLGIPVLREGNILELARQRLSVVEACSGIRSLLSLSFLALVYGWFFEKRNWMRAVLFFATVPIAIVANASRVTLTGILTDVKPELAEGFFHTASGWVIFMVALVILVIFHQGLEKTRRLLRRA